MVTKAKTARRLVEDGTRPQGKEEDSKREDKWQAREAKAKGNGDRDRRTSVVEKGDEGYRHSNSGPDKTKI